MVIAAASIVATSSPSMGTWSRAICAHDASFPMSARTPTPWRTNASILGEAVPRGAVAPEKPHVPLGVNQLRREGEPRADAEGPEHARIEPGERRARGHDVRRRGDEVPAVTDEDRRIGERALTVRRR